MGNDVNSDHLSNWLYSLMHKVPREGVIIDDNILGSLG